MYIRKAASKSISSKWPRLRSAINLSVFLGGVGKGAAKPPLFPSPDQIRLWTPSEAEV